MSSRWRFGARSEIWELVSKAGKLPYLVWKYTWTTDRFCLRVWRVSFRLELYTSGSIWWTSKVAWRRENMRGSVFRRIGVWRRFVEGSKSCLYLTPGQKTFVAGKYTNCPCQVEWGHCQNQRIPFQLDSTRFRKILKKVWWKMNITITLCRDAVESDDVGIEWYPPGIRTRGKGRCQCPSLGLRCQTV